MATDREMVYVKAPSTHDRVAFFEQHRAHPDGEVFVAGNSPPQPAALTPLLRDALRDGLLVALDPQEPAALPAAIFVETPAVPPVEIAEPETETEPTRPGAAPAGRRGRAPKAE